MLIVSTVLNVGKETSVIREVTTSNCNVDISDSSIGKNLLSPNLLVTGGDFLGINNYLSPEKTQPVNLGETNEFMYPE